MNGSFSSRVITAALAGAVLFAFALPAPAQSTAGRTRTGLRNVRYCEILIASRKALKIQAVVYNTLGLSDCPAASWSKIDAAAIKQQSKAIMVDKNGPRYWVIDSMSYGGGNVMRTFGDIPMREVAVAELPLSTLAGHPSQPYRETSIARSTVWSYAAGKPVFVLISPQGVTYAMQSYSQIVDPHLSYADLPTLASRLHLPPGWQYAVFTPAKTLSLSSNGMAHVIQDDFKDTYQRW